MYQSVTYKVLEPVLVLQIIHIQLDMTSCNTIRNACPVPATAAESGSEQGAQPGMQQEFAQLPKTQPSPWQHATEEMCVQLPGALSARAPSLESGPPGHPHTWMLALLSVCACGHGPNLQLEAVHSLALGVQSVRV